MEKFKKINKPTYQHQIYNILEKMIISGQLQPRHRLVESDLAQSMGVSRSPVREAILHLEQEGLVINTKKGGWIVSEVSLRDILELYDLRKLIEVYAIKKGCLNCPQEIKNKMESNVGELKSQDIEIGVWQENNKRFHELIVQSSGNIKIYEVFLRTMKSLRWCTYLALAVLGRQEQSILEHRNILEVFLKQDPELAGKVICEHIETVQKNIKSQWESVGFLKK
jgi:DNA-binding GntR family transcriptional regulator